MNRRISLLFLLANVSVVFAQPLYKWVEQDGTITFSPTPPTGGTNFEKIDVVNPASSSPVLEAAPTAAAQSATPPPIPAPAKAMPRMEYAPGNPRDLPEAISRSPATTAVQPVTSGIAVTRQLGATAVDADTDQSASTNAATYKQSRCQDLKKRVTSLERRMKSRLSPEDMDNTVIYMARYQRSHDQYCSQ
ncbi:DUF4124 domain-containing protein [Granulosicoccus antarcticus]|uniref:DUF4124 domain-containing protein n=1 Tax=Granulosicoccus antarcticus IMCC3135 TaxID=1192854 RepID=A0A2Z2NUN5_9GAMM|nr:DUF4124 domain-containing protein [Granulosicoccus antarcticus]ASJ74963.1 hypothetical protein IMCC3135_24480 [Granulosicoccus antarcticus IMCC3135]